MLTLEETLTGRRCALVVVDVQNDFCHPDGPFAQKGLDISRAEAIQPPLHALLAAARARGVPVIFIQNVEDESTDTEAWRLRPDGAEDSPNAGVTRRGSWGAEFYGVTPEPGDAVVEKHRFNAFYHTRLGTVLQAQGAQTLVFAGLATNVCVLTSATHAVVAGYHVVLAEDACAAWFQDAHDAAVKNIRLFVGKVSDSRTICALWGGAARP